MIYYPTRDLQGEWQSSQTKWSAEKIPAQRYGDSLGESQFSQYGQFVFSGRAGKKKKLVLLHIYN